MGNIGTYTIIIKAVTISTVLVNVCSPYLKTDVNQYSLRDASLNNDCVSTSFLRPFIMRVGEKLCFSIPLESPTRPQERSAPDVCNL